MPLRNALAMFSVPRSLPRACPAALATPASVLPTRTLRPSLRAYTAPAPKQMDNEDYGFAIGDWSASPEPVRPPTREELEARFAAVATRTKGKEDSMKFAAAMDFSEGEEALDKRVGKERVVLCPPKA